MQIDYIKILFSLVFSAIFGYICYCFDSDSVYNMIVPGISLWILTAAVSIKWPKQNPGVKSVLWLGIVLQLIVPLCFVIWVHNLEILLIAESLIIVSVLWMAYSIYSSK